MIEQIAMAMDGIEVRDGVPQEIKILPLGRVTSTKGSFLVDDVSVRMILQAFKDRKIDMVVDYEHQTLMGVQAPAGGWIRDLKAGADAILAKVEWTEKAAEYLKNKEYRYLSPVIMIRKDGRVAGIHSVSLTNVPSINGMFAMCSAGLADFITEENSMEIKEVAALLGLSEDATEDEVRTALKDAGKKEEKTVANSTILGLLELPENAKTEEVTAKIMSLKSGDVSLAKRVEELEEQLKGQTADAAVQKALKAGKISAAQKDWARDYAMKDPEGFASFTEQAPAVVPMGRLDLKDAPKDPAVDDIRLKVLKNMGLTKEDYEKYAAKEEE